MLATLRNSLAGDDRQMRIAGWTRLGLVEVSRERRGLRWRAVSPPIARLARAKAGQYRRAGRRVTRCGRRSPKPADPAAPPSLTVGSGDTRAVARAARFGNDGGGRQPGARIALIEADMPPARGFDVLQPAAGPERGG